MVFYERMMSRKRSIFETEDDDSSSEIKKIKLETLSQSKQDLIFETAFPINEDVPVSKKLPAERRLRKEILSEITIRLERLGYDLSGINQEQLYSNFINARRRNTIKKKVYNPEFLNIIKKFVSVSPDAYTLSQDTNETLKMLVYVFPSPGVIVVELPMGFSAATYTFKFIHTITIEEQLRRIRNMFINVPNFRLRWIWKPEITFESILDSLEKDQKISKKKKGIIQNVVWSILGLKEDVFIHDPLMKTTTREWSGFCDRISHKTLKQFERDLSGLISNEDVNEWCRERSEGKTNRRIKDLERAFRKVSIGSKTAEMNISYCCETCGLYTPLYCAGCEKVAYCNLNCQQVGWYKHKLQCN